MRLILRRDVETPDRYSLFLGRSYEPGGQDVRLWSGDAEVAWQLARIAAVEIHGAIEAGTGAAWNAAAEVSARQFIVEIDHDASDHTGCLIDLELSFEDRQPVRLPIWRGGLTVAEAFCRAGSAYGEVVRIRRSAPAPRRETPVEFLLRLEQRAAWFDYMKRSRQSQTVQTMAPVRLSPEEIAALKRIAAENFARFGRNDDIDELIADDGTMLMRKPATALKILLRQRSMLEKASEETG